MQQSLSQQAIKKIDQKLGKNYKHYIDNRLKSQIQLSNQLARSLSQLNFIRLANKPIYNSNKKTLSKQDVLYVCLNGVPPFQEEFKALELPGQSTQFRFICFEKGKTEEELKSMPTEFENQAKLLDKQIQQASKSKPIVFVYHSFGSFILAAYCQQFSTERVVGLIDIGGAPIRFYPLIKEIVRKQDGITLEVVQENIDLIYHLYTQSNNKYGVVPYDNKYQLLGFIRCFKKGIGFNQTFQVLRNLPKVLKCFIYGRRDSIFPEDMINEKTIYYSYRNLFEPHYEQRISQTYKKCFGTKADRVQQRFIYSLEGGNHSIHMQKKHKETVAKIVERYLSFLEQIYAEEQPKI